MNDVPRRAQALSLTLRQYPDAIVTSPDTAYLGRIAGVAGSSASGSSEPGSGQNSARQTDGPVNHVIRNPGNIWGGSNSVFHNPGQLTGGPNSVVNNPGQILGGSNSVINNPGQLAGGPNSVVNNPGQILGGSNSVINRIVAPATTKKLATLGMRSASDQVPLNLRRSSRAWAEQAAISPCTHSRQGRRAA